MAEHDPAYTPVPGTDPGASPEPNGDGLSGNNGEEQDPATIPCARLAGVFVKFDVYDAVVVAAFGELKLDLGGAVEELKVHPFWILVSALAVFAAQFSTLLYFTLDQDLTAPVRHHETSSDVLYMAKLTTVVILQVTMFSPLLSAFKLLAFVVNPVTWLECRWPMARFVQKHFWRSKVTEVPSECTEVPSECKPGEYFFLVAPFLAVLAVMMKLYITYQVLVASVSVILACRTVTEALFNGLAMTFVVDLGRIVCKVLSSLCSLDEFVDEEGGESLIQVDLDAQWKLYKEARGDQKPPRDQQPPPNYKHPFLIYFMNSIRVNYWFKEEELQEAWVGANTLTTVVSAIGICYIYYRQLNVVAYAIDTNVLPISRDVCTYERWFEGKSHTTMTWGFAIIFTQMSRHLTVLNVERDIKQVTDPARGGYCTEHYDRMRNPDRDRLYEEYPGLYWILLGLVTVLVVPHVVHFAMRTLAKQRPESRDPAQGASQGASQDASQGASQGASQDASQGASQKARSEWDLYPELVYELRRQASLMDLINGPAATSRQ